MMTKKSAGSDTNPKNVTGQRRCSKKLRISVTRGRKSVCVGTSLDLLHPILSSNVMGTVAMMVVLICRARKTKNALSCRKLWEHMAICCEEGERTCAGAKVVSHLLFYDRTTQITHTLHHHHTIIIPRSDICSLSPLPAPLFYYLFSLFFSWTIGGQSTVLAATPTYVPVTDSFAFTVLEYSMLHAHPCALTPSPPFLVSYLHAYYRRSLYTSTVS